MQSIPYSRHGESPVLTTELQPDVLLFGLGPLIGSGRPGFDGHYRVVRIGPRKAIEFFDGPPMGAGNYPSRSFRTDRGKSRPLQSERRMKRSAGSSRAA